MNHYEMRQEARRQRLERIAAKLQAEGDARYARARQMASAIPFGQPILVGHHSEKRDRNYRGRIHQNFSKAFEATKAAERYAAKAAAVGTGGISSDDPDAVLKLRAELLELEHKQALMKAVNEAHKRFLKDPASLEQASLSPAMKQHVRLYKPAYSWEPHPFPPYRLQNNGANIRRVKQRIEALAAQAAQADAPAKEHDCGTFRVVENFQENRLQLFFPGKPADAVRQLLKSHGFRWSPLAGAWQRHLSGCSAEYVTGYLGEQIAKAAA